MNLLTQQPARGFSPVILASLPLRTWISYLITLKDSRAAPRGKDAPGKRPETVSKTIVPPKCLSERSEESSVFKYLDPSLRLRVTEKISFETVSPDPPVPTTSGCGKKLWPPF